MSVAAAPRFSALEVQGYRSIRRLALDLAPLTVVVGPNGSGKTNLYRALYLMCAAAGGGLAEALAEEGGMPSALWAGRRDDGPVRMTVACTLDELRYELVLGLPPTTPGDPTAFVLDPDVKEETLQVLEGRRKFTVLERRATTAHLRTAEGDRAAFPTALATWESVLAQIVEPQRFPLAEAMRRALRSVRFYHHFRTDPTSPLRAPRVGVRTPVLAHDGRDLAAALQTIREIGDGPALDRHVDDAFPGARLGVERDRGARFSVTLTAAGLSRALSAAELSDGTLRYLCLMAALLSPRPPLAMALNEPETSLHPDLLPALARLIAAAGARTQLWVTTHSRVLSESLARDAGARLVVLEKSAGETRVARVEG